jgi:hypothetical protein
MTEVSRRDWSRMDFKRRQAWRALTRTSKSNGAAICTERGVAVGFSGTALSINHARQNGKRRNANEVFLLVNTLTRL